MSLFTIYPTTVVYETVTVNKLDVLVPSKLETLIDLPKNRRAALVLTRTKDRYAIKFVAPQGMEGLGVFWEATENRYLYGMTQAIEEYTKAVQELPRHLENLSNLLR